jgi:hypothetical protein
MLLGARCSQIGRLPSRQATHCDAFMRAAIWPFYRARSPDRKIVSHTNNRFTPRCSGCRAAWREFAFLEGTGSTAAAAALERISRYAIIGAAADARVDRMIDNNICQLPNRSYARANVAFALGGTNKRIAISPEANYLAKRNESIRNRLHLLL